MEVTIGLAQTCHPADGDVVSLVREYACKAREASVDLLVFPECLMSRYESSLGDFLAQSQPLDGDFPRAVAEIAREHGLWIVFTMNELNGKGGLPYNTAVVVDDEGVQRGVYRKVHLFDSETTRESERMAPSDALFDPIDTPFGRLGLAICYDLRFPEVARHAALHSCDLLVYPSAWVAGPDKVRHWEALLAARAIENELFVAGVCRADYGYIGNSMLVGPDGVVRARADETEGLTVARIDSSDLERVRRRIPVLEHRRPDVY